VFLRFILSIFSLFISFSSFFILFHRNGARFGGGLAFGGLVWWFGFELRAVPSQVVTLDQVILDCRSRINDLYPRMINPVKDYFQEIMIFFCGEWLHIFWGWLFRS